MATIIKQIIGVLPGGRCILMFDYVVMVKGDSRCHLKQNCYVRGIAVDFLLSYSNSVGGGGFEISRCMMEIYFRV